MAMGGDFMQGAINAGIAVGFNHLAHQMDNPGKPKRKQLDPSTTKKIFLG